MKKERRVFRELLVIVHPNWLEHVSVFGIEKARAKQLVQSLYAKGMVSDVDFKRYKKAMFDVYGRTIIEASKRPDVLVAIFAVPMKLSEYKALAERDREVIKRAEHTDVLRFIDFARELLGKRLIVINSPALNELRYDAERLCSIIARKGISFSKDFVIRGCGEISAACVRSVVTELKFLLNPKKAYVDKKLCGDIIANFPERRVIKHTSKEHKKTGKKMRSALRRL